MIRKLAFHEISQKLPFQGNKKKELNHYDLALFFASAPNVKNCIFSDAWGLMGRIVINLCLGVYFAKPEEEKYAARHYMFLTADKRSATRG